jgi:CheY-like chemotaxis protein
METYHSLVPEYRKTILLVEDDDCIATMIFKTLTHETLHHIYKVATGRRAINFTKSIKPDLLILSHCLPDMTGLDVYDHIHTVQAQEQIPTILICATLPLDKIGERNIICQERPLDLDHLLQTIDTLVLFPCCPIESVGGYGNGPYAKRAVKNTVNGKQT